MIVRLTRTLGVGGQWEFVLEVERSGLSARDQARMAEAEAERYRATLNAVLAASEMDAHSIVRDGLGGGL